MLFPIAPEFATGATTRDRRRALVGQGVAAASTGALYFLSWPGYELWPLALVAFVPLLWVLESARGVSRQAVAFGWLAGTVKSVGGFSWLYETLLTYSQMSRPACALFAASIWIYQGSSLALFAWLYVRGRSFGLRVLTAAVCSLCIVEWGFPELFLHYFGLSLHRLPHALQIADLGGPLVVSAVLMTANVASLGLLSRLRIVRWREVAVAVLACVATLAYGSYRIDEVDTRAAHARKLDVAIIQANLSVEEKRRGSGDGLRRHLELSAAVQPRPDLIVWPETVADWDNVESVPAALREHGIVIPVLFGARLRLPDDQGMRRHANVALGTNPLGEVVASYHKIKLLPFAEYMPFGESYPGVYKLSPRPRRFMPGELPPMMQIGDLRVGVSICYEDLFASFIANGVREHRPHLLANLTNDAWFGDTIEPYQHAALAKLRAVENHRSVVRATNSGVSELVDPVGRELSTSGVFVRQTLRAVVPLLEEPTLYMQLGDAAAYVALLTMLGAFLRRDPKRS